MRAGLSVAAALTVPLMVLGLRAGAAEAPQRSPETLQPDPELQRVIQRALNPRSEEDLKAQLQRLRELGGRNLEKLIPQLLYYSVYGKGPGGERDVKEAMALAIIGRQLDISPGSIFTALVRLIETDDPALRKEVHNLLDGCDFSYFESHVWGHVHRAVPLPPPLVRYMYRRAPGESMLAFASAFLVTATPLPVANRQKRKSLLWADHVVADTLWKHQHGFLDKSKVEPEAAAQIEKLSKDDAWWVRLYVAEIMRQHPAFRTPELVARLAADKHPLVREAMSFATGKPEAPAKALKPSPGPGAPPSRLPKPQPKPEPKPGLSRVR